MKKSQKFLNSVIAVIAFAVILVVSTTSVFANDTKSNEDVYFQKEPCGQTYSINIPGCLYNGTYSGWCSAEEWSVFYNNVVDSCS
ncbi:hypothetical protein ACFSQP_08525 [Bizionia sediminis]|uniref:Uncharacterized protein n=1 Tax=Bizionia sediminis TaxID=1737064 RepID=A0ABW5KTZ5_9FLAO